MVPLGWESECRVPTPHFGRLSDAVRTLISTRGNHTRWIPAELLLTQQSLQLADVSVKGSQGLDETTETANQVSLRSHGGDEIPM